MRRAWPCLLVVIACQKKLEGPSPAINGVSPPAVCQQQLTTTVELSGDGLSPLVTGALAEQKLELPRVTLSRVKDLGGSPAEGAVEIPDDPKDPSASRVRWKSQQAMSFQIFPELSLPPGLYDIVVANSNGQGTTYAGGLLAVPPPVLTRLSPDLVCGDKQNELVLTGDFFIEGFGGKPTVKIGDKSFAPTSMEGCRELPGSSGLKSCTVLRLDLPADSLTAAVHSVSVINPGPVGCATTEPVKLTVVPEPTLTKLEPDLVCTAQGENVLKATGTDFLTVDGATPKLILSNASQTVALNTVASDCQPLPGPSETVQRCATLLATLPMNGLSPGSYRAKVLNPPPADCSSAQDVELAVVPAPEITSVVPDVECNADGAVAIQVNGTGFLVVNGQSPTVRVGTAELPSMPGGCTTVSGTTQNAQTCTQLLVSVPSSVPFGTHDVVVKNPSPAGCSSASGKKLTLFDRPQIASIVPAGVCSQSGGTPVVITGANFVTLTQGGVRTVPVVTIGTQTYTPVPSGCQTVPDTANPVEACSMLTITVAGTSFTPNTYDLVVTNPEPVGCSSNATGNFAVTPPPSISSVLPTNICSSGDVVQLNGANFLPGATVSLDRLDGGPSIMAQSVLVDGGTALATFSTGLPTGTYEVSLSNGNGCSAKAPIDVNVIPGPQLFFVDPSIVYNGITVQATVFGTGFTLPVNDVALLPSDGGAAVSLAVTNATQVNRAQVLMRNIDGGQLPRGTYDMVLDDSTSCVARLPNAVTVVDQATLVLKGMEPPFGTQGQSTSVSILADVMASGDAGFVPVPRVYLNPSNPGPNTVASPVGAVAYVDESSLTALVPSLPAGDYDLIVVNPDRRVGVKAGAFKVTPPNQPPPSISSISPGSLPNTGTSSLKIFGANFRSPAAVTLQCVDQNGMPTSSPTVTVGTVSPTDIDVSISNVGASAACVVRVTNTDNGTYADFSALVFTNPAKNLYLAQNGPSLNVARRAPVALGGDATGAARFLYVLGGDSGGATPTAYDSVETSALTLVGVPGPFFTQRQGKLNQPRAFAGGARIGRWLYVAGGSNGSTRYNTVERAFILDPARRGEVVDLLIEADPESAGLSPGLYYYRVAAVMDGSDPFNPNGEELAADPFPVQLPAVRSLRYHVTVTWAAVPGAIKYRVYRSPTAGAPAGAEQVIAEVNAPATSYQDMGGAPIAPDTPLPMGSLSRWQTLSATLSLPREGPGVTWARDPANPNVAYLYVLGGRQSSTTATNTYEYLAIALNSDGTQTPSASFTSGGSNTLSSARWQLSAATGTNELSPRIAPGKSYVWALSGLSAMGSIQQVPNGAEVQPGGALSSFVSLPNANRAGYACVVAADQVFAFGGNNATAESTIINGEICGVGNSTGQCATNPSPPHISNWNTGQNMNAARYLMGGALHGAFIYIAGGNGSTGSPLASTEYRIW